MVSGSHLRPSPVKNQPFKSTAQVLLQFIRINDRLIFGFSEAQLIALVLITIGTVGYFRLTKPNFQIQS